VYAGDGTPIEVGSTMQRALLARLALSPGEVVPRDALIAELWGSRSPADVVKAMNALVYRLRKAIGDEGVLESVANGYRLRIESEHVDAERFEALAGRARRELAAGSAAEAAALLRAALVLWRGAALDDVSDLPFAGAAGARLQELRICAIEDRFEAELRLGHHGEILADLEAAAADHPLRERLAAIHIRALHAAGCQSDALALYERLRRTLADELGIDPSPELQAAHLAVLRGEPSAHATAEPAGPGRLPARLTSFIGRDDELELLSGLLDASRLVTLAGPGGVGKTRLATEAAVRHRAHRRGRCWLISLADASDASGVADAIMSGLAATASSPARAAESDTDRIVGLLGIDESLLILDNCEQAATAVAQLTGQLLQRQPHLTILATSREPLEVVGEALLRLGPLPLPPAGPDTARTFASPAVRLFLERAAAVRPGFELDETTMRPVVDIVRRLDGLPLALELAAARLRTMTADQIAARLGDRFRLLASGNRSAQPRQQTLQAVIGWSWDLLTDEERTLARRISMFTAGTGLDAIEAICSDDALPAGDFAYVFDSLVGKSLVEQDPEGCRMLESIRSFASEQLRLSGELEAVRGRFTRHYAKMAEELEPHLRSERQPDALRTLKAEYDNLIAALGTAIDSGDATDASRILGPLYWFWDTMRFDGRSDAYVARVLAMGDQLPSDTRAAFTAIHLMAGGGEPVTDPERISELTDDCARTGALERYPMLLMVTLVTASMAGLNDLVDREIARVRNGTDQWSVAATFVIEAVRHHDRGDWHGAAIAVEEALRSYELSGDQWWTATVLAGVARLHSIAGRTDMAIAAHERGMALVSALSPHEVISHRLGLAYVRMRARDAAGALRDIETARRATWDHGQPVLEVEALLALSELHRRSGEIDRSDRELDRFEHLARRIPLPEQDIENRLASARMAGFLARGEAQGARELLPRVVRVACVHKDPAPAAELLARLLHLEKEPHGAATALGMSRAIRGAFDQGDPELCDLAATLARLLGRDEYDARFKMGAEMPRQEAIDRLAD
jgi:predicted ATPase/DNA-binding SARP family transcriptional activator